MKLTSKRQERRLNLLVDQAIAEAQLAMAEEVLPLAEDCALYCEISDEIAALQYRLEQIDLGLARIAHVYRRMADLAKELGR